MEKSIGALWVQTNDKGEYWKGYIELEEGKRENVIVFKNTYKKDKQPDYRVFKQTQKVETKPQDDEALPF